MQLEKLWDDLSKEYQFALLCTYLSNSFDVNDYDESIEHVCQAHSHLLPFEHGEITSIPAKEEAIHLFRSAWERVIEKIAVAKQIPQAPL